VSGPISEPWDARHDNCPGCLALQEALQGHILHFSCKKPDWDLHADRLRVAGYELIGEPEEYQLMDHRTPRLHGRWLRYDRPGDPWWDDSIATGLRVLDWLRHPDAQ